MGLRYRKSIKIAPGVKLNVGKKSIGVSVGNKYGGISVNSKTGTRGRISAPGTGISYSTQLNQKKRKKASPSKTKSGVPSNLPTPKKEKPVVTKHELYETVIKKNKLTQKKTKLYKRIYTISSIILILFGTFLLLFDLWGILFIVFGIVYIYLSFMYSDILKTCFQSPKSNL